MEGKEASSLPMDARMRDSFLFANTIQFLRLFHEVLNIDLLSPSVRSPPLPVWLMVVLSPVVPLEIRGCPAGGARAGRGHLCPIYHL